MLASTFVSHFVRLHCFEQAPQLLRISVKQTIDDADNDEILMMIQKLTGSSKQPLRIWENHKRSDNFNVVFLFHYYPA